MPTYDYVCEACEHRLEQFQTMTDRKLRKCPKCGALRLIRLIGSGGGVLFRGDGFPGRDLKRRKQSRKWRSR